MKTINNFFFGEDTVSLSDFLWFYGIIALITFIGVGVWIPQLMDLAKVVI